MVVFDRIERIRQVKTRVKVRIRALKDSFKGITSLVSFALTQEYYLFRGGRSVSLLYSLQQFHTVLYCFWPDETVLGKC